MQTNLSLQENFNNSSINTQTDYNIGFGQKKCPRYIYHITRRYKYEKMLSDGYLKTSTKDAYIKEPAIFAIELQNFFKNWGYNKAWNNKTFPEPLFQALLDKIGSKCDVLNVWLSKFVILKIPTKSLDKDKLKIRSQKTFFEQIMSDDCRKMPNSTVKDHLSGHTPATQSRRYNNRKEAIEYIYLDDIPIDKIEVVNNLHPLFKPSILDTQNEYLNILKNLFKGTPQENELKNFRV